MIYEIRTYRLKTGATPAYLRLIGEECIALQKKYLGRLIGYFHSDIGPLNEIVHIWAYADIADRERRREALLRDPAWQALLPRIQGHIETMENKIMKPAPFWTQNDAQTTAIGSENRRLTEEV
jgi:hypothetical protein